MARKRFIDQASEAAIQRYGQGIEGVRTHLRHAELRRLCHELLEAYTEEEEEHGFPFNFRLRAAHRDLAKWMRS